MTQVQFVFVETPGAHLSHTKGPPTKARSSICWRLFLSGLEVRLVRTHSKQPTIKHAVIISIYCHIFLLLNIITMIIKHIIRLAFCLLLIMHWLHWVYLFSSGLNDFIFPACSFDFVAPKPFFINAVQCIKGGKLHTFQAVMAISTFSTACDRSCEITKDKRPLF